ncbi:serine/threonine-protein kinase-like protein, partial [Euroglyphus maynei]
PLFSEISKCNSQLPDTNSDDEEISVSGKKLLQKSNYTIVKFIDKGSTSKVFKVIRNDQYYAAKIVDCNQLSDLLRKRFLPNEMKIVTTLKHPNIIHTEEVLANDECSIIITEFAPDGDLMSYIERQSASPDMERAKHWAIQIIQGLVYLHSKGIAHLDIKADNVLLCQGVAKISDFTYAQCSLDPITNNVIPCTTFCGTLEYKAPETLHRAAPFNPFIADCFSLGVLIYTLVTMEFPFGSGSDLRTTAGLQRLHDNIQKKQWHSNHLIKANRKLYSLLKQLLNPDIDERITAEQALVHSWFDGFKGKK